MYHIYLIIQYLIQNDNFTRFYYIFPSFTPTKMDLSNITFYSNLILTIQNFYNYQELYLIYDRHSKFGLGKHSPAFTGRETFNYECTLSDAFNI